MEATNLYCDNQSCINLSENLVFHDRSKHIDIRCHFIRDCVQRGVVQLLYVPIEEQVANILTKSLGSVSFCSIGCVLAMKFGGEARIHEISKTQKSFLETLLRSVSIRLLTDF